MKSFIKYILWSLLFFIVSAVHSAELSYPDIVNRLIDLEALAVLPEKGEKCAMWSSYDRLSRYDEKSGRYVNWNANSDGLNQFIRKEGDDIVMAEMKGPGAIVRIWSAQPQDGHVKIYIDGSEEPVINLPFRNYFDNTVSPFNFPELVYSAASGQNNYVPIPYKKSCKVVAEPGWGNYFHFNYITFKKRTKIKPFTMKLDDAALNALKTVNDYFADKKGTIPGPPSKDNQIIKGYKEIEAGQTVTLAEINGEYAIKSFRIKANFDNRLVEEIATRKILLHMYWDGEQEPSVWSPLGDFFGTTPGKNNYKTLPLGMTETFMYSLWTMPFAQNAVIQLTNMDDVEHYVEFEIIYGPTNKPAKKLGRFHAKWHGDVFPLSDPNRWPDWTVLKTTGKGRFVGMRLHVLNQDGESCKEFAGPGHAWWGEGDEKFFVDGEMFPSTFGTGTEDYFGYAWGTPEFFEKAFHSQSMTMNNVGHQTVSRFHIIDNIPFQKSFDGFIEKYYPNNCGTKYDCVVYWYLSRDGKDFHKPDSIYVDKWIPAPVIQPDKGKFLRGDSINVKIISDYDNILYTLDGDEPTLESLSYDEPIIIDETSVLKAKVFTVSGRESNSAMGYYERVFLRPSVEIPTIPEPGLFYEYYEGEWLELPDFAQLTPVDSGIAEIFDLSKVKREDDYGLRYTGYIKVPKDGMYTFYLNSDDGSKLFIGDELVVDNDKCHGAVEIAGQVALSSGFHPLTVIFFEAKLYNVFEVRYSGPDIEKQQVAADILFHEVIF